MTERRIPLEIVERVKHRGRGKWIWVIVPSGFITIFWVFLAAYGISWAFQQPVPEDAQLEIAHQSVAMLGITPIITALVVLLFGLNELNDSEFRELEKEGIRYVRPRGRWVKKYE